MDIRMKLLALVYVYWLYTEYVMWVAFHNLFVGTIPCSQRYWMTHEHNYLLTVSNLVSLLFYNPYIWHMAEDGRTPVYSKRVNVKICGGVPIACLFCYQILCLLILSYVSSRRKEDGQKKMPYCNLGIIDEVHIIHVV